MPTAVEQYQAEVEKIHKKYHAELQQIFQGKTPRADSYLQDTEKDAEKQKEGDNWKKYTAHLDDLFRGNTRRVDDYLSRH